MNNPRLSYRRFSTFSSSNFWSGSTFSGRFSGVREPNFIKLAEDIWRSSTLGEFVSDFRLLHFATQAAQRQVMSILEFEFRTKWGAVGNFDRHTNKSTRAQTSAKADLLQIPSAGIWSLDQDHFQNLMGTFSSKDTSVAKFS